MPDDDPYLPADPTVTNAPVPPGEAEQFGFASVPAGAKKRLVRGVFDSVARRYDLMNDLMSGGIHRLWKHEMIRTLSLSPGQHLLDVAGGTGDIAFRARAMMQGIAARRRGTPIDPVDPAGRVTVCDINQSMLAVGRDRAIDRAIIDGIDWVCGDAESLPVKTGSVDAYSIAFGLRNVTDIDAALREARRVLRPGGRFVCLEFSRLAVPQLRRAYDLYSFEMLPRFGRWVAGDADAYRYLAESIRQFPPQDELVERMGAAGLGQVRYRNVSAGIAAIHSAWRL